MDTPPLDPWKALGVERTADEAEIRTAYKKLVLKCHPDKIADPKLKEQKQDEFQKVQRAYWILNDDGEREKFKHMERRAKAKAASMGIPSPRPQDYPADEVDLDSAYGREREGRRDRERERDREWERDRSRERYDEQERDRERQEFLRFALQLFDEVKASGGPVPLVADTQRPGQRHSARDHTAADNVPKSALDQTKHSEEPATATPQETNRPETRPDDQRHGAAGPGTEKPPTKADKLYAVPPAQLNLEQMNPDLEDPLVDFVAVHGLGAIPDITWKEKKSGTVWLSDKSMLPAAIPRARILRFGYDSLWMGDTPIRTTLSTIAIKLLLCLSVARAEDLDRPLIFLGHCFGGLVIQRALILAKMHPTKYPGFFDSCIGAIFLGTPHRGSNSFTQDSALLTAIAAASDVYQHLETDVLDAMTSKSGSLLDVADDFISLCVNGGPEVSCFFEQRSSMLGKVIGRHNIKEFIVDAKSATFDGHPKYGLEVDHFSLNKFDGPKNPNYIQVCAVIKDFYRAAIKARKLSSFGPTRESTQGQPQEKRVGRRGRDATAEQQSVPARNRATEKPEDVEHIRKEAIKELHEDEARKLAARREEEYKKRAAEEKRAAERAYCERLKRNMRKYGVSNPDAILQAHPLPQDEDLESEQEIRDKGKWYQSILRGLLSKEGLDGGQIDEILNHTGETMTVDGVDTAFTKMARRWVSTRTLDGYNIPWMKDEEDDTSIIVTRWVPDYEKDFIWDHAYAQPISREKRDRAREREKEKVRDDQGKAWLLRTWEKFKTAQQDADTTKKHQRRRSNEYSRVHRAQSPPARSRRHDAPSRPSAHRSASTESMRSAPDMEEVSRRRRHSRTLSRGSSPVRALRNPKPVIEAYQSKDDFYVRTTTSGDMRVKEPEMCYEAPDTAHFKVKESRHYVPEGVRYSDFPYKRYTGVGEEYYWEAA